jgi:small subunit ribosomal protein S3
MSVVKHFIEDSIKKTQIDEFLQNEFERAGYGGVSITKTPLGTHLVIYTMRPGIVIGRGGETIRALATVLEENFNLPSPQISVAEIEIPELNAYVVASRIASALKRGVHYRRAGFWGLTQIMDAGALGAEIIISGKLRTDRARYEKFRTGYLPKSGEPPRQFMRHAELHVQLKPGVLGVKVSLIPPESSFPDQVKVHIIEDAFENEPEKEIVAEKAAVTEEKVVEPAVPTDVPVAEPTVSSVEEKVEPETKVAEPEVPLAEDKKVTEEKVAEVKVPATEETKVEEVNAPVSEQKAVADEKTAKKKATSVKKKPKAKKAEPEVTEPKATKAKAAPKKKAAKKETKPVKEKPAAKKETKAKKSKPAAPAKEKAAPKKKATEKKVAKKAPSKKAKKETKE